MTQESEPKKKEPPREKPDGLSENSGAKLPPPAEAPALRENAPSASAVPATRKLVADRLKAPKSGDLEGTLRSGLILALVIAVGALLWLGLRSAIRASGSYSSSGSSSPEAVSRNFLEAVKKGDAKAATACIDWERVTLQAQGPAFGKLSDAKKESALERYRGLMTRMMSEGGELQKLFLDQEFRVQDVTVGPDVAEVTVLALNRKTGRENANTMRLERQGGSWKIYRLPEL